MLRFRCFSSRDDCFSDGHVDFFDVSKSCDARFFALMLFVESDVVSRRAVVMRCFAFDVFSDRDDGFCDGHAAFLDARNIVRCKVRFPSDHARCEC